MVETLNIKHSALNKRLFDEAKKYLVGGVNSPVRSFKQVGDYPIFIKRGRGSKIYSESGREFIDYCLSWGALILGHSHPEVKQELKKAIEMGSSFGAATKLEIELAKLIIEAMPSIEQVRLTNSGTEAVMAAIRLARAFTKKNKIIKFAGSYHGHADYLLNCPGVPENFTKFTLVASYGDSKKVEDLLKNDKDIAAVIVEPVAANMGVVLPEAGFLKELRKLTVKYNIILIFDEVITGFRLSFGGAQELFQIKPDLTTLGKIIGAGLPSGAFGGRKEIMRLLAPEGGVYQAGTFSGNPLTTSAGLVTLKKLMQLNPYQKLADETRYLCRGLETIAKRNRVKLKINFIGSMFSISLADFKKFYQGMLEEGIYLSPSALETDFLSIRHRALDLEKTLRAAEKTFQNL